jgi:REP element-mobilizing transposase RayT
MSKINMAQSLVKNYIHIVFSTKNREHLIDSAIEPQLHSYLGGICNIYNSPAIKVGGYTDHIHILCLFSQKITLMKLMQELKSSSSKWIKTMGKKYQDFYWQNGYGAFSVSPSKVEIATKYIENQHIHHKEKTYQDEYRGILKKYKIDYDERFVWD